MFKKILIGLSVLMLLLVGGFVAWGSNAYPPMPEAQAALADNAQVNVTVENWLVFEPSSMDYSTGLIFYPGGRVDARAYAPYAQALAQAGYLVVIPKMPLHLAVLDADEASNVIRAYPQVQTWAVGGHSLGGAMAARYAARNPQQVDGLILLAAYPASSDSLAASGIEVVSIHAANDQLATLEKIQDSQPLLPEDALFVRIEGGNHAQFGWYGEQFGDGPAQISREAQQSQTVAASLALLEKISEP